MLEPVYAFVDGLMNVYGLAHVILYTVVAISKLYQNVCMPHNSSQSDGPDCTA